VLHFAVADEGGTSRIHVIGADDGPRWQPLPGGDDTTTWIELGFGGRYPEPPTRLSQSVLERAAKSSLGAVLGALRSKVPDDRASIASWCGRSYLSLDALAAALANVPLLDADDLLVAVGGPEERRRALVSRAHEAGKSFWRRPLVGSSALFEQLSLEGDLERTERALEREARVLGDLDLALLPLDALSTTLTGAQALAERTAELWLRSAAAQLAHALAARAIVRRQVPDVDARVGWALTAGAGGLYLPSMAGALRRAADVVRRDEAALARLPDPAVTALEHVPDGPARGALGQLLSRYGDLALGAFELGVPRWREQPRDLFTMVQLLCAAPSRSPELLAKQARAAADAELARWETELGRIERRLLHEVIDRARKLAQRRIAVDRHLFRALALVRRVATDVDRRLRRVDPAVRDAGAFHCSAERLAGALKSGRPELGRIIAMRAAERAEQAREPAPPPSFVASPPRGATPVVERPVLSGVGVSPGVVAGRARLVHGTLPERLEAGDILVLSSFDAVAAPLLLVADGVVAESGGMLSLGAEVARELAVPMVASATDAALVLRDGERIRIDGASGVVERLELARAERPSAPVAREAPAP
jgi:pyruvate,water dikinase